MNKSIFTLLVFVFSLSAQAQTRAPSAPGAAGRIDDPASIASVRLVVGHPTHGTSRQRIVLGKTPAAITATFVSVGGGTVSGRWELATPADGIPTATDLTPAPLLSNTARMQQRRFRQKETFSFSLYPGERRVLAGPVITAADLPAVGRYHVLLKIDSVSSINSTVAKMPNRISPVVLEVEFPKPPVTTPPATTDSAK